MLESKFCFFSFCYAKNACITILYPNPAYIQHWPKICFSFYYEKKKKKILPKSNLHSTLSQNVFCQNLNNILPESKFYCFSFYYAKKYMLPKSNLYSILSKNIFCQNLNNILLESQFYCFSFCYAKAATNILNLLFLVI